MSNDLLLTFNAGSSIMKIGIFERSGGKLKRIGNGVVDLLHDPVVLCLTEGSQIFEEPLEAARSDDHLALVQETLARLEAHFDFDRIVYAGHRVVQGGLLFVGPTLMP